MDWQSILSRYEHELLQLIIPFWEKNAIDEKYGGYFTFLDRDGTVYDTSKFMWMQWRIVYMFATLYISKYKKEKWLDLAVKGYEFLTKNGRDQASNYYFALNQKGEPIIAPYNIYSEAFAIMGSAALYKATNEEKYKIHAFQALNNYVKRLDDPKGKWEKSMPARKTYMSFGNYMILANLGLIVKDYLGSNDHEKEVSKAIDLILNHFWNEEYKVIFENINQDYTLDLNSCEGRHVIPGHGLEACWFILQHAELNKKEDIFQKVAYIIKSQLELGWDNKFGGIFYFMDVLGKPHLELQWNMKLWWVHCEALIATLHAYRLTKDPTLLEWFKKIDEWTWTHFPDPEHGEWYGYLNRRGEPTHLLKGGKWKTFFHLPRFLLICIEQLNRLIGNHPPI